MSVIVSKTPHISAVSIAVGIARQTIVRSARMLRLAAEAVAEARMQRTKLEAEFYLRRYKHTSKNDDDLPIVR